MAQLPIMTAKRTRDTAGLTYGAASSPRLSGYTLSREVVEIRRFEHAESGEVYVCVSDVKDWCHELLFKFNEVNADLDDTAAIAAKGIRVAFNTILTELDRIQIKGE
jgi:hypothetical protein